MRLPTRRKTLIAAFTFLCLALISGVFLLPRMADAHLLYTWQATGTVFSFHSDPQDGLHLMVQEASPRPSTATSPTGFVGESYRSVSGRAIALPPGVLHEGATFEKHSMSRYCRVDGKEYVFVRFFPWQ
jgi:hypothetical protein